MTRAGKLYQGSHEYQIAPDMTACLMGNDLWTVFRAGQDTGMDFKTLAGARRWAKANQ